MLSISRLSRHSRPTTTRLFGSTASPKLQQLAKTTPILPASLSNVAQYQNAFYQPKPQEEDARPLIPKFWTGKSAVPFKDFQVDCSKFNLKKILSHVNEDGKPAVLENCKETEALREVMEDRWKTLGTMHLIHTGLTDFDGMRALTEVLHPKQMTYDGGANNRGHIEQNVYDTGAPKEADLQYHHEMAYVKYSTKHLAFCCLEGTFNPYKGATFLSVNNGAHKMLMGSPMGEKLKNKGLCYIRKLPDRKHFLDNCLDTSIVYNFWQTSFDTEDMEQAANDAREQGLEIEWQESPIFGRYMVTKFYVDTFEYDPYTDANRMFASVADDYAWFDSWPGVMDLPHWERPLKLAYGDGEVMTRDEKQFWVDCYDAHGVPIIWQRGDVAIQCNFRFAHGRPGYDLLPGERRELGVVLGEPFARQGARADKSYD